MAFKLDTASALRVLGLSAGELFWAKIDHSLAERQAHS